jgi:hypothetical protein
MRLGTTSTMWTVSVGTSFALHLALAAALSLAVATQVAEQVQETQISFSTMDLLPAAADPIPLAEAEALAPAELATETSEFTTPEAIGPPQVADAVEPPSAEVLAETPETVQAQEATAGAIEPEAAAAAAISDPQAAAEVAAETVVGTDVADVASAVEAVQADPIAEMIAAAETEPSATVTASEESETAAVPDSEVATQTAPAETIVATEEATTAGTVEAGQAQFVAGEIATESQSFATVTAAETFEAAPSPAVDVAPPTSSEAVTIGGVEVPPSDPIAGMILAAEPALATTPAVIAAPATGAPLASPSTQTVAAVSSPLTPSTATVTATATVAAPPVQSAKPLAPMVAQPQVIQGTEPEETVEVADVPDDSLVTVPPVEPEIEETPDPGPRYASLGAVVDYIAGYRSPSCFAAYATEEPDGSVKVSAFSADATAEAGLRATMGAAVDGEVAMQMNRLSEAQCGVLKFARGVPGYPATGIGVDLASHRIANGGALAVTIDTRRAPYTYVLVVDDEGSIGEVRRFEQPDTAVVSFEQAITLQGGGASAVQLLVVVTSSVPLDTEAFYGELAKGTADRYFNELIFETVMRETMDESVFDVAITEFVVE